MKMDSYRRFVRSPLYQKCTLGSVEGKLLLQPERTGSLDNVASRSPSTSSKVKKKKQKQRGSKYLYLMFCKFKFVCNRTRNLTPAIYQKASVRNGSRKEDPGEVGVSELSISGFYLPQSFHPCLLLLLSGCG